MIRSMLRRTATVDNRFISTWNTTLTQTGSSASDQVKVPFITVTSYTIDWGDGSSEVITSADPSPTHTYTVSGVYTIIVDGEMFINWTSSASSDRLKLLEINNWGNNALFNTVSTFALCQNLEIPALDAPNLSGSVLAKSFENCRFTTIPNINNWDFTVAGNVPMENFFGLNPNFNQNLSVDFSAQTQFVGMFLSCTAFNSSLNGCDFSSGTNFTNFLRNCDAYNQPFTGVQFGSVSALTNFDSMFRDCAILNQPLTAASFPRPQNLSNMLVLTRAYNSTIDFDFSEVSNAGAFLNLNNNAFSTANYDALLIHIDSMPTLVSSVTLSVNAFYTSGGAGETARANIIATYGWTITDKGAI